jgi:hypothetical protein
MSKDNYLTKMRNFFRDHYHCEATHIETVSVIDRPQGKAVWKGKVEVFQLSGHPSTSRGYAWVFDKMKDSGIIALPEIPPVVSPETAVQVFLTSSTAPSGWQVGKSFSIGRISKDRKKGSRMKKGGKLA